MRTTGGASSLPPTSGQTYGGANPSAVIGYSCHESALVGRSDCTGACLFGFGGSSLGGVAIGEKRPALRLRLKPGGAIEGFVVDERGAGVPTFTLGIEAYSSARHRQGDGGRPRGFEDPRGAFRLDNLAPGSYVLTASTSGRPPARSEAIEVVGGAPTRGVRIVLAKGGSVSGVVYDEGHKPLADVEVGFDSVSSVLASNASDARWDRHPDGPKPLAGSVHDSPTARLRAGTP